MARRTATRLALRVPFPVLRIALLASVAVIASVYALIRFYTYPRPPMLVPIEAGEREIPAPEIEPLTK